MAKETTCCAARAGGLDFYTDVNRQNERAGHSGNQQLAALQSGRAAPEYSTTTQPYVYFLHTFINKTTATHYVFFLPTKLVLSAEWSS